MDTWEKLLGESSKADELSTSQVIELLPDPRTIVEYRQGSSAIIYPIHAKEALRYTPKSLFEKCILKLLCSWTNRDSRLLDK